MGRRRARRAGFREIVVYALFALFTSIWCLVAGECLIPSALNNMANGMMAHALDQRIELTQHRYTVWPNRFPAAPTVEWIRTQPESTRTAQLSIWDRTGSNQPKVLRIRDTAGASINGVNKGDPYATVYLPAATKIDVMIRPGNYDIVAISGNGWNAKAGFDGQATTVSYGSISLTAAHSSVIVMGADDQPMRQVSRDWL